MTVSIFRQPQNVTCYDEDNIFYDVLVTANGTVTYQWYETTAGAIGGETDYRLSFQALAADNGKSYYVQITDDDGMVQSTTATLTVLATEIVIVSHPQNAVVTEGELVTFTAEASRGTSVGPAGTTYQWYETTAGLLPGETSQTLDFIASLSDDGNGYYMIATRNAEQATSNTATLDVYAAAEPTPDDPRGSRTALVWNWEDDTYTWMDASHAVSGALQGVVCMNYGFDPGWQQPWQTWIDAATTWNDLLTADTRWQALSEAADEKNLYWLTTNNLLKSDQAIETNNGKEYFVERRKMDLDDMVPEWTTDKFKHLRQFMFHMRSDLPAGFKGTNQFDMTVGWSINLMDDPDYTQPVTVNLHKTSRNGKHKADLRTTGRYLSMKFDFNSTQAFQLTGGDMDAEEAHGR